MDNPFQIFTSPIFGSVRAALLDGEIWFVGSDACLALGYARPDKAIQRHVAEGDKKKVLVPILDGTKRAMKDIRRYMFVINESGLYSLTLSSNMPQAQEFKHWVTSEVLPSIRKTGSYSLLQQVTTADDSQTQIADILKRLAKLESEFDGAAQAFDSLIAEMQKKLSPTERAAALAALSLLMPPTERNKILLHAANLIAGKNIF